MSTTIGIDLGTTCASVACMEGDAAVLVSDEDGAQRTPSVVAVDLGACGGDASAETDPPVHTEILLGHAARRQAVLNAANTAGVIVRFLGRRYADVCDEAAHVPYHLQAGDRGQACIHLGKISYPPPVLAALLLHRLRRLAERTAGQPVGRSVMAVPADFGAAQRRALMDAAQLSGLEAPALLDAPLAAALAFRDAHKAPPRRLAVVDLGGGFAQIAMVHLSDKAVTQQAAWGDSRLGGEDFDRCVVQALCDEFGRNEGVDLAADPVALQRLKEAAEHAKRRLSTATECEINLPFIAADAAGPKHLTSALSRLQFEQLVAPLLGRLQGLCQTALDQAGKATPEAVLLLGGMAAVPCLRACLADSFACPLLQPDDAASLVARGAALRAAMQADSPTVVTRREVPAAGQGAADGMTAAELAAWLPRLQAVTGEGAEALRDTASTLLATAERSLQNVRGRVAVDDLASVAQEVAGLRHALDAEDDTDEGLQRRVAHLSRTIERLEHLGRPPG